MDYNQYNRFDREQRGSAGSTPRHTPDADSLLNWNPWSSPFADWNPRHKNIWAPIGQIPDEDWQWPVQERLNHPNRGDSGYQITLERNEVPEVEKWEHFSQDVVPLTEPEVNRQYSIPKMPYVIRECEDEHKNEFWEQIPLNLVYLDVEVSQFVCAGKTYRYITLTLNDKAKKKLDRYIRLRKEVSSVVINENWNSFCYRCPGKRGYDRMWQNLVLGKPGYVGTFGQRKIAMPTIRKPQGSRCSDPEDEPSPHDAKPLIHRLAIGQKVKLYDIEYQKLENGTLQRVDTIQTPVSNEVTDIWSDADYEGKIDKLRLRDGNSLEFLGFFRHKIKDQELKKIVVSMINPCVYEFPTERIAIPLHLLEDRDADLLAFHHGI